jgi:hypothetical protein
VKRRPVQKWIDAAPHQTQVDRLRAWLHANRHAEDDVIYTVRKADAAALLVEIDGTQKPEPVIY